jgi:uncharacterized protein YyaL (SSP411 family)
MTDIRWQHFDSTTIAEAARSDRPVLLVITVPWCQHCRRLLSTTFADARVQRAVEQGFVPVHVDAERRPDVNQRFGTGAWPTIAWLTPHGELVTHTNFLEVDELCAQLERVRKAWRDRKQDIEKGLHDLWAHAGRPAERGGDRLRRQMTEDVTDAIYEKLDHRHGGFGESSKFPHPEAIDFALVQVSKRGDPRMREVVELTLDRMLASPLRDHVHGGFFRYSRTPDWHTPDYEKLLDQNTLVLRACLEAYQVFEKGDYREAAEGIVDWMLTSMRDRTTGAFAGSQDGDHDYFTASAAERARHPAPSIDRTIYCHANALAVSGLLKAAAVLGKPSWRELAMTTLNFLLTNLYDGREVYHYWDGTYHLPGMLGDQAHLIRALIDAAQNTGDSDLLLPAEAIAEAAIAHQKSPTGGFYDILQDPHHHGSMRRRNRSILDNATMAESLVRLSYLSRRPELGDEAIAALESFADDYKEYGYNVAGYGRAVDLVFYEPLFVTVVGDRDCAAAAALRHAALTTYVPSRIVQTLDPTRDPILLGRSGLDAGERPRAYVAVGRDVQGVAEDGAELLALIARVEMERRAQLG